MVDTTHATQVTALISGSSQAGLVDQEETVDAMGYLLLNYRSHPRDAGVIMPMLEQRFARPTGIGHQPIDRQGCEACS